MRARVVAAIALSGAVALGLSGCNFVTPPATTEHYDPSDGVSLDLGQLSLRNVMVITNDGETGGLLGVAINPTGADIEFSIQWQEGGSYHEVDLRAHPHGRTNFGFGDGARVALEPLGVKPGGLLDAVVHIADNQDGLEIPVLDASLVDYQDALPTPSAAG